MVEWQKMNPFKKASEWIIWRNNQKAAAAVAENQRVKLLPVENRPFNHARIKEDEAPQLHVLSSAGNKGDNATDGSAQEEEKQDDASSGNEHFSPSSMEDNLEDENLGDALDRMLNSSSSLSPVNGTAQN